MRIAQSVVEPIGQTPMIRLTKLTDSAMAEVW